MQIVKKIPKQTTHFGSEVGEYVCSIVSLPWEINFPTTSVGMNRGRTVMVLPQTAYDSGVDKPKLRAVMLQDAAGCCKMLQGAAGFYRVL